MREARTSPGSYVLLPTSRQTFYRRFNEAAPPDVQFHHLRHAYGSLLVSENINPASSKS
jgi:hypothetical protein